MTMDASNAKHRVANDDDPEAQLCAYNTAFEELDLMFRWDAGTLVALAPINGDRERVCAYIERHHPHLLTAYSADFLCQAIVDKKNQHYHACAESAALRHGRHGQSRHDSPGVRSDESAMTPQG
jgi:hypothetical protein